MAIAAGAAFGVLHPQFADLANSSDLKETIISRQYQFFLEVALWVLVLLLDLWVSWAIWLFFKSVSQSVARWAAWFRLLYSVFLGIAIANYIKLALQLDHLDPLVVMELFNSFDSIWNAGLIIFGFHLLMLAYGTFLDTSFPRVLSYLLVVAGLGYVLVSGLKTGHINFDGLELIESTFAIPMTVGELGFGVYLFIKGAKS